MHWFRNFIVCFAATLCVALVHAPTQAQTLGIAAKKPVFAGACAMCPWGELGDFVHDAMKPAGFDVQVCYNCNLNGGAPRFVGDRVMPPALDQHAHDLHTFTRPNAPPDFGVTNTTALRSAYLGTDQYKTDGPRRQLRFIAKIEDPSYLIVAVKKSSGITDLKQIAAKHLPVRIVTGGTGVDVILKYYGLDKISSWGGSLNAGGFAGQGGMNDIHKKPEFDVAISGGASLGANPEVNFWYESTQKFDLTFMQLPNDLLNQIRQVNRGSMLVYMPIEYMRGVDRKILTVGRSGQAIMTRADVSDAFAYEVAKAVDQHRDMLKWHIRPYSYDPRTVTESDGVPLHPGAERYYREAGYLKK